MMRRFVFYLIITILFACGPAQYQAQSEQVQYLKPQKSNPDSQMQALIQPYKKQLSAEMNTVVGTAVRELPLGQPESLMGNWVADLVAEYCREQSETPVDFAVMNIGGLRIPSLPRGPITKGKLFELMPFDNTLVIVEVNGEVVKQLFQHLALKGGWPVSKEVKLRIQNGRAISMQYKGQPIENERQYHIATNSYIASGGDDCSFFVDKKRVELGALFRDVLIQHTQRCTEKGQAIDAELQQRIEVVGQ